MNTNFFNQIEQLDIQGNLQLNIIKTEQGRFIVSILLHNEQCGNNARKLIPPLNLRGTAEELDAGFFPQIATPLQTASGLMVNMEAFMKQLEKAKKESTRSRDKNTKESKNVDSREKKFLEAMRKADDLELQGKFRQAWSAIPEPSLYPDKAEDLLKRRASLSSKFEPDLFGSSEEETNPEALYPNYHADDMEEEMESEEDIY